MRYYPLSAKILGNTSVKTSFTMTKVNSFDVNGMIDKVSDYSPVVLFATMIVMFCLTGWMQHHFLKGVFLDKFPGANYLVFLFPIVVQVLRFITGFLSASFFKKSKWFYGVFVFCFSVWLSVFEFGEVENMAILWTDFDVDLKPVTHNDMTVSISKEIITGVMTVLIWGALVLEFFLAAWVGSASPTLLEHDQNNVSFSSNGANKKGEKFAPSSLS